MTKSLFLGLMIISGSAFSQSKSTPVQPDKRTIAFDSNWYFQKDSIINAEAVAFDDSKWRKIDLPHDWSIEDLPDQTAGKIIGPFNKSAIGGGATGFTDGGTGWYRKKFVLGENTHGKMVSIDFDGVYMNSDVWLNGHHLGNHPYGYTPFYYDLTPYLNTTGQTNVLAVRAKNEGKNSRWYSGSGIYRHVWLTVTDLVRINPRGVYITTTGVSKNSATINIKTNIGNKQRKLNGISLVTTIIDPQSRTAGTTQNNVVLQRDTFVTDSQTITISHPFLWSTETPHLYKAITEIKNGDKTIDRVETSFGIRSIHFDAVTGFLLNGKRVILKGGCIHHDNGLLGAATIDRAEERKIEILKQNGYNAIRTSHNPPSKQMLDACDHLGMLVIDEAFDAWEKGKNPQDYHLYFKEWWKKDLDAMILRDRNHPSVILWSIGNEINERADTSGIRITGQLVAEVHRLDATRPVTEAICQFWDHPGYKWDTTARAFSLLDVGGYNYLADRYQSDHQKYPDRIIVGTETFANGALQNYDMAQKLPYVLGDFVWTAVDYLGEASIGNSTIDSVRRMRLSLGWPWNNAWCGDIDLIGNKKPQSWYRDIVWGQKPIAIAVHPPVPTGMVENVSPWGWPLEYQSWTWPGVEGKELQVRVFSRAKMVRLLLNGKTIGEQKIDPGSITAVFKVPYQPGTLTAVNIEDGKATNKVELKTAGTPVHLVLRADRVKIKNSRNDLSYVMVELTDDKNQIVPTAEILVHFSVSGAGEIAAVGNASPNEPASYQGTDSKTFEGRCLVIIRPKGKPGIIGLKATAKGLSPANIVINTYGKQ